MTDEQKIKQLEFAIQSLEVDHARLKAVNDMMELIRGNLADWRKEFLKSDQETTEEILLKEAIATVRDIIGYE